ncbi:dormancy-associated protein homolog 3-like isoform X4 [Brassica napus]|nr:dormancy-associated protein homolog 3-like isoform X4 [Brassica napus]
MGLLDHLWDDTVAGPLPENGLGKLRKHHTFSFRPSSANDQSEVRSYGGDSPEEAVKVTRSIMIIKPPGYQSGSAPVSPASSTTPVSPSPFSGEFLTFTPLCFHFGRDDKKKVSWRKETLSV